MIITPFFLLVFLMSFPHKDLAALIIFAVAAITDAIDGKLARKNNEITVFGKLLDPVADKMLTTAALLAFLKLGLCGVWPVMIILTREFVITSIRLIASSQGIVIPANIWGKCKTICQMVFTIVIILLCEIQSAFEIFPDGILALVSDIMMWITAVFAVVSGLIYVANSRKLIDFSK